MTSFGYAGKQCVCVTAVEDNQVVGIQQSQPQLAFAADTKYDLRLCVRTEIDRLLTIEIIDDAGHGVYHESLKCKRGDWQILTASFVPHEQHTNCTLKVTSAQTGKFWIGCVSLLPSDNFHGMRRDVIKLLKKLKPGCLRFPGGCYEEYYNWQDGLLPVDQRPPVGPTGLWFLLTDTDDYDNHEIGIDEFMALCRELNAEPAISTRMSEKLPDDAAAWVEYCNGDQTTKWGKVRIERGHAKPYRVQWWFIGNEIYAFGRGNLTNADVHAEQSRLFCEAMLQVDNELKLITCTQFSEGKAWPLWNTPAVQSTKQYIHGISVHQYILDQMKLETSADYEAVVKTPSTWVVDTLKLARQLLDEQSPGLTRSIVYDEWNMMWGRTGTVAGGLYVAGILSTLCRYSESLGIEMGCYFMPVNEGAIKAEPLSAEFDTGGYVFELFAAHQGNRRIDVSCTEAEVCASLSADGKQIVVTAVNGITEPKHLKFSVANQFSDDMHVEITHLVPRSLAINETQWDRSKQQMVTSRDINLVLQRGEIARLVIKL